MGNAAPCPSNEGIAFVRVQIIDSCPDRPWVHGQIMDGPYTGDLTYINPHPSFDLKKLPLGTIIHTDIPQALNTEAAQ